ncbi:MAG: CoA transferase [Chloroflexi bacterium]|nr:CoA transferase [Chloroflexota bacterium]
MTSQSSSNSRGGEISALGHLRVLELPGVTGLHLGKILADMGADVIKVEPPEGDFARSVGPFYKDMPHPEGSLYFLNFNTNKRSIVIDLTSQEGQRLFRRLVATADVVIESFQPGYLDSLGLGYKELSRLNPGLVTTSITPFGQTGPYKDFVGTDLIAQAMGGLMYIQGDDTKAPCVQPCDQAYQLACTHATYATLAALNYRRRSGRGQHVDVSLQDIEAHLLYTICRYAFSLEINRRVGNQSTGGGPNGYYTCQDGRDVSVSMIMPHQWKSFKEWMDNEILKDPIWDDRDHRRENPEVLPAIVQEFIGRFDREEFVREAQKKRLPVIPINNLEDVVTDPQNRTRGDFFIKSAHPYIGEYRHPGAPYRFTETPWKIRRPAPLLGQHKDEILQELKNGPRVKIVKGSNGRRSNKGDLPLAGVRIADFTRIWAGPLGTRYLADLGAEVIRLETNTFLDTGRGRAVEVGFPDRNRSKLSVSVDFKTPEGRDLVKRLVQVSDIVIDNFASGVLERRGLGYEELKKWKPDIIMISMPGFGNKGPYADYVAFGAEMMAVTGLTYLWGYADSPQVARSKVYYTDYASGAIAACCMMIALECRNQTGKGQHIELAQSEAATTTMGVGLLDYLVNGKNWEPLGNRNFTAAPHGAYPCRGDDQWCAIACWTQDHWERLCKVAGKLPWTSDPRFATQESRWKNQDALDAAIGSWTKEYTPYQMMHMLQRNRVPAGVVQSGEQLFHDIHLRARNFIVPIEHCPPEGTMWHTSVNVNLSETPGRVRGLHALGQDNDYVFGEILGLSKDEVARLTEKKVLY